MILEGTRLGNIEIEREKIISVPEGILGFPKSKRYVILNHGEDSPFKWFQSVDEPALSFVIVNPLLFVPEADYTSHIFNREIPLLRPFSTEDLLVMAIVTIQKDLEDITINLQGPLVINVKSQLAQQVVLVDTPYTTRYSIKSLFFPKTGETEPQATPQTL